MKYRSLFTRLYCAFKSKDFQSLCGKETTPYLLKLSDPKCNEEAGAAFLKNLENGQLLSINHTKITFETICYPWFDIEFRVICNMKQSCQFLQVGNSGVRPKSFLSRK